MEIEPVKDHAAMLVAEIDAHKRTSQALEAVRV